MHRARAAVTGALLGQLPGLAALAVVEAAWNPAFVDDPVRLWLVLCGVPALVLSAWFALRRTFNVGPAVWLVGAPLVGVLALGWTGPSGPVDGLRVLVFGIDGATWDEADRMAADLPHLTALRRDGATGIMRAEGPLFSPLLWSAIATGRPREEHGVSGFHTRADDCRVATVWDIADDQGLRVGLMKWLVTWPPRQWHVPGGFTVPGWTAPSAETWPPDLGFVKEPELRFRHRGGGDSGRRSLVSWAFDGVRGGWRGGTLLDAAAWWLVRDPDRSFYEGQHLRARLDRDVFVFRVRRDKPQVAALVDYATDAIGHRGWHLHEPAAFGAAPSEAIDPLAVAYHDADAFLGELRGLLPADGRLVVLSDHGFQALPGDRELRVGPRTDVLAQELRARGLHFDVQRVGARVSLVPTAEGRAGERTSAEVWLAEVVREDNGEALFRWAPDPDDPSVLVVDLRAVTVPPTAMESTAGGRPLRDWLRALPAQTGDHTPRGLFAAVGPGAEAGLRVDVGLYDVAPVLLAAMGLPADVTMRGGVPDGLWPEVGSRSDWSGARARAVFVPVSADVSDTPALLEALGYIDR